VEFKFPTILIIHEQRTLEPLTSGGEKGKGRRKNFSLVRYKEESAFNMEDLFKKIFSTRKRVKISASELNFEEREKEQRLKVQKNFFPSPFPSSFICVCLR
jgi:hypothetical protein